jgi:hypothetical protein
MTWTSSFGVGGLYTPPPRTTPTPAATRTGQSVTGLAMIGAERPAASSAARDISAAVGSAVEAALGSVAPYSSHGGMFTGEAEIEHIDAAGARTRARLRFTYGRGNRGL